MNKCDPFTRAQCPYGTYCESFAVYTDTCECAKFKESLHNSVMTNADRIRSMSDEELADFMNNFNICDTRENDECKFTFLANCKECVMEWLKRPVTEVTS